MLLHLLRAGVRRVGMGLPRTTTTVARRGLAQLPPHTLVSLPALSPTMASGGLAGWKLKEGDAVRPGSVLCEIETDKATVDMEMQEDGFLARILVPQGTTGIPVGSVIAVMTDDASSVPAFASTSLADFSKGASPPVSSPSASTAAVAAAPDEAKKTKKPAPSPDDNKAANTQERRPASSSGNPSGSRVFASPLARKLARETNKDLSQIAGSGPNGRVLAADVREAREQQAGSGEAAGAAAASSASGAAGDYASWSLNKLVTPHYYLDVEVDLTGLLEIRDTLNKDRKEDAHISVNDFVVKALGVCAARVPEANSAWGDNGAMRMYQFCDVNVAVADANGLVRTSLIKGVHASGLDTIAARSRQIAREVSSASALDESPGTVSVVNVGAYGVRTMVPIVRPGQAVALGVGAIRKVVVPSDSKTTTTTARVAHVCTFSLSCDHRVVDGAVGAQFLQHFKTILEKPIQMLL